MANSEYNLTVVNGTALTISLSGPVGPAGAGGGGGTVDEAITDGSTNAVSGNAVFDALALKAPLASPSFTGAVVCSTTTAATDAIYAYSETGSGVVASSFSSTALYAESESGMGTNASTVSGTYHAKFGDTDINQSFVARVKGAFGWIRGSFTGRIHPPDTITADRTYTLPDGSGTVALVNSAQTFTGLQQSSTRPRSSAALTPANTTELITLADGDSRYGAFYNGVSIPQVSSTNNTPIKVASVILPIGVYQIDSFVASVHGTVGLCTIGLRTSQTAKITAFENYGNDNTSHVSSAIATDNFAGASQRSATSGGTFSRRVTGIIEIATASTELSIEYCQGVTDASASLTRKRAYITATKLS